MNGFGSDKLPWKW
jgi:hypothetical protein